MINDIQTPYNLKKRINRRAFLRKFAIGVAGAALAVSTGGLLYSSLIETAWVDWTSIPLTLPHLAKSFDGFKLVQISDIHLSSAMTGSQLSRVAQTIRLAKPDLVTITGDFVDRETDLQTPYADLVDALSPLARDVPIVYILGNHEYSAGILPLRAAMQKVGAQELTNRAINLQRDQHSLSIAGLDDWMWGKPDLAAALADLPSEREAAILLIHEPDYADIAAKSGRFDLQLSGHTHGGQVILPFLRQWAALPRYGKKYRSGLYSVGQMWHYTNRGLGTSIPRIRFNCRPEVTIFTLNAPE